MMYEPRFYRTSFNTERFHGFTIGYKETDLWIGIDPDSYSSALTNYAEERIRYYRNQLEQYLLIDPEYGKSLVPVPVRSSAPPIAREMAKAAERAGVGPMAAVAGAFSEWIGTDILANFKVNELVIENGGDIFLVVKKDLVFSVYAGNSPFSGKIGITIPASDTPLGVCTSAGTVGPSLSFGKTDATMLVCKNTALADAWATSLGNRVIQPDDIEPVLNLTEKIPEILSCIIVCKDKVGIRGNYELKLIR
ncbi:MAG: UPF0280 family protein [Bacteroidota bacterium]|nr:UPF0280 family protein [Bacteroidota bacterium]MDP4205935.1 UPF0280 family protein [Bacteroidota bacterium]